VKSAELSGSLPQMILTWYDRHHRQMPWRVSPVARAAGTPPDPYHVWLSEVMLQQTTVAAVGRYFTEFTTRWPTVTDLAEAPQEQVLAAWAGLGYYARARNLHRCAQAVAARPGARFPDTEAELQALPGIGPYTAAAIAAIAFDRPATVLDGNVERVMARLHAEADPLPGVKKRLRVHAAALTPRERPGDYAQAVMDLGATICTPRRPACGNCPWRGACAGYAAGIAATLPVKAPKKAKPVRHGTAFFAIDHSGRILTERRPESGLLGGMLALPTTDWAEDPPNAAPPVTADWSVADEVRHTFTHFHLRLAVMWARVETLPAGAAKLDEAEAAMPTVFAKASRAGRAAAGAQGSATRD
jgi:A/G-specific adenine glycosylase